ncbi:hypothetical protein KX729_22680 [Rhizobium sp. XQZ8]|uniref:hypothetical protein n=1 Tax=Rhizobium populisoli TaxID=2859785 RepID=UPI001CA482C5|nr:hypothetical protein [Rhizobium populisoli]MBW6424264.1 hypothetical protein [Rhizobium populisoli]
MAKKAMSSIELLKTWILPPEATLGSSVRAKRILLEIRARLPIDSRKSLELDAVELTLAMPAEEKAEFKAASAIVTIVLQDIERLPIIPHEIEDILSIKASERHRWLGDGRLPSAGTRTVNLRGRAKKITFHVYDPKVVVDLLDRGSADLWREEDAATKVENRRRAAHKAKLARSLKQASTVKPERTADAATKLRGWDDFDIDGLLR